MREQLEGYGDPGWYDNPVATLANNAQKADLLRDGIDVNADPGVTDGGA